MAALNPMDQFHRAIMTKDRASYRRILRSTSIIGGATAGSIMIGLFRMKIITLLIGATGVGLFGVFNAIVVTAQLAAGLGVSTSGVTELAAASEDEAAATRVRSALWSLTWLLALAGGIALWVFRDPIAAFAAGGAEHSLAVGMLGLAVSLNVIANAQLAVFQGYRRIGDLGRVKLYGALLAAPIGVAAVYAWPYYGIVAALVAVPLALLVVGIVYGRRLPRRQGRAASAPSLGREWRALVSIGFGVMLWTMMGSAAQIAVRAIIVQESGLDAAGLFQAAWMISANSQVLILAAMLNDYLARLSGVAADTGAVQQLVDEQLHVALLLAAPLIAAMIAAAPLALTILYSHEFTGAARLLQWQVLGDVLKISGWSLSFLLLARKDMAFFLAAELSFNLFYLAALYVLLPFLGLDGAGISYFAAYSLYNLLIVLICWRRHAIVMSASNFRLLGAILAILLALVMLGSWSQLATFVAGTATAALFGYYSLRQLGGIAGATPAGLRSMIDRLRSR